MKSFSSATVALLAVAVGACNVVTGADGISFDEGDEGSEYIDGVQQSTGQGGASSNSGAGTGAATGATTGAGTGGAPTTGSGGDPSSGAGGDPSTTDTGAGVTTGGGEMCGGAGPGTTPLDTEEQAFLTIINAYRTQNGLGTLEHCVSLDRAAQGHSEDMRDQDYFDHTGLDGSAPWDRACNACYELGCGPSTAMAENIAAGNSGAQATFDQWKNSPGHNANMLDGDFTMIGIGRATGGGTYGVYWTNVFGGASEPSCQ